MIYTEKERAVYQCPVTGRFYDPLAVKRGLAVRGGFNAAVAESQSPDEQTRAAGEEKLVAASRKAFGFAPVDPKTGEGVTDAVALEALTAFTRWLKGKGETALGGRNDAPCTACQTAP